MVFWKVTYPINQQTSNCTVAPANWLELRRQWEYSHATDAVLNVLALVRLMLAVLV